MFPEVCLFGQKPLCELGILKFCQKYENVKMPTVQLLIYMISASFVPNLAGLYLTIARVCRTNICLVITIGTFSVNPEPGPITLLPTLQD